MNFKLSNRKFGVEIEYYGTPASNLVSEMRARGLNVQSTGYTHSTTPYWKIVSDSSVHGNYAAELVSPILSGVDGMVQLKLACEALEAAGAKVNRSCGLHVHHDASDFNTSKIRKLAAYYIRWQSIIDQLVAPSRRSDGSNYYCKSLTSNNGYRSAQNFINNNRYLNHMPDRYHTVNTREAFARHNTIEFRQHQGTTSYEKIEMWVVLTQNIVERAASNGLRISDSQTHFKGFRDGLRAVGQDLVDEFGTRAARNMVKRFKHFTNNASLYQTF